MDYLWTPWRYQYIASAAGQSAECVFCAVGGPADEDRRTLVVHRAAHNFVILNRFPYTSGHAMVVPYAHIATPEDLPDETLAEMMRLARDAVKHLRAIYRPEGLNLGMNIGRCAGAGIAGHVHMHVLPRWTGDANFMTVTGETRVLPETLDTTWEKLAAAFRRAQPRP
jgi:ATP adenylyltransferase